LKGNPCLLSDGLLPNEAPFAKSHRESQFPLASVVKGINAKLQDGSTTVAADRDHIFDCIRSKCMGKLEEGLDAANQALHGHLACAAWPQAIKTQCVSNLDGISLPETLNANIRLKTLVLDFAYSGVGDQEIADIADGLPPLLVHLRLNFEGCAALTDEGVVYLARRLPGTLECLWLDFLGCKELTDLSVKSLVNEFPSNLKDCSLHFQGCERIGHSSVEALATKMRERKNIKCRVNLLGSKVNRDFKSVWALREYSISHKAAQLVNIPMGVLKRQQLGQ